MNAFFSVRKKRADLFVVPVEHQHLSGSSNSVHEDIAMGGQVYCPAVENFVVGEDSSFSSALFVIFRKPPVPQVQESLRIQVCDRDDAVELVFGFTDDAAVLDQIDARCRPDPEPIAGIRQQRLDVIAAERGVRILIEDLIRASVVAVEPSSGSDPDVSLIVPRHRGNIRIGQNIGSRRHLRNIIPS